MGLQNHTPTHEANCGRHCSSLCTNVLSLLQKGVQEVGREREATWTWTSTKGSRKRLHQRSPRTQCLPAVPNVLAAFDEGDAEPVPPHRTHPDPAATEKSKVESGE